MFKSLGMTPREANLDQYFKARDKNKAMGGKGTRN